MSRVAKAPVELPNGVQVTLSAGHIAIKGGKGTLQMDIHNAVEIKQEDNVLTFEARDGSKLSRAMSGTTRALVNNMVTGVSAGFQKKLQLVGVGYRAQMKGKTLSLSLGFSHPVDYELPEGVSAETPTQTEVVISGIDKQLVGQVAAEIRDFRRPEPYKGKGVRYADEMVRRKEAKKK
ncbi:50S ribosomal protein L6 [Parendozoicomonas haliclonae]|uniref:Large ribosomal subunit protein uL6 n=1 Tax=Parendozoicomonas haliclonae TaxID=1960125 RepID=A0A1X7AQM0_9GAMM|nr:50S ribosomal protein L6 [Parendozoicomonas haliclonae]SMA49707.1 50S ribosomal protein L6 [Parendozoicomonas haliclonae]